MTRTEPLLIALAGLPGTGKTTLAMHLARALEATTLRIDAIEHALRRSGALADDVGPAGYMVGYALAEANLRLGRTVVADSVNPVRATRDGWRAAAAAAACPILEVELACSDLQEHRRRVETRVADLEGFALPDWERAIGRDYEGWDGPRLVLDTVALSIEAQVAAVQARVLSPP